MAVGRIALISDLIAACHRFSSFEKTAFLLFRSGVGYGRVFGTRAKKERAQFFLMRPEWNVLAVRRMINAARSINAVTAALGEGRGGGMDINLDLDKAQGSRSLARQAFDACYHFPSIPCRVSTRMFGPSKWVCYCILTSRLLSLWGIIVKGQRRRKKRKKKERRNL